MTSPVLTPSDPQIGALADPTGIPLPETRRTGRARRKEKRRRRQQRQMAVGGSVALVIVLAAALVVRVVAGPSPEGGGPAGDGGAAATAPPAFLLVQRDDADHALSLFLLVPAAGGKGGTLLLLPPGTMAEAASLGLQPLSDVLELGGPSRLLATVQNLLGASLADVHVVDGPGLVGVVAPAGSLTVKIPERVERVDQRGVVDVVYEPGPRKVEPAEVPRLLAEKGRGTDLSRLARHQAFWDAWLARLDDRADALPAGPPALRRALTALAAGPVRTRVLPVAALSTGGPIELYRVERDELARLTASVFPTAPRVAGARPRVQILNGTGVPGLGQRVSEKLGAQFDVRLTGNAARFDYAETQVVFYDRKAQSTAERVRAALGVGKLVLSRNPLDVVNVTIIVGKDFK